MRKRILIVEDDLDTSTMIKEYLEESFEITSVPDGNAGLAIMNKDEFDIVILDWNLPKLSGVQVCRQYRDGGGSKPILMLTGNSELDDKTNGFESGADDYLTKPFLLKELRLRIDALLRRASMAPHTQGNVLRAHDVELDVAAATVKKNGLDAQLYRSDFALLEFLMRHPGQVFSPEALIAKVFNASTDYSPESIRSSIKRIRQAVDSADHPSLITTVHRVGYKFRR